MIENPVVEEVNRIRAAMLAKHGGDLHALVQEAERFEISPSVAAVPFDVKDLGDDWDGSYSNPIVEEVHRIRAEMLAEQADDFSASRDAIRSPAELPSHSMLESVSES